GGACRPRWRATAGSMVSPWTTESLAYFTRYAHGGPLFCHPAPRSATHGGGADRGPGLSVSPGLLCAQGALTGTLVAHSRGQDGPFVTTESNVQRAGQNRSSPGIKEVPSFQLCDTLRGL